VSGRYIALEGIEGTGKSTVADRLAAKLEASGLNVVSVREPGGTASGERVRDILLSPASDLMPWTEALLFAAGRAQLVGEVVGPALQADSWVVSDRSVYSSLAYQGGGRGLGVDAVRALNEPGLEGVWPELVVLLRLDPATGLERQQVADRIGGEGTEFQGRVAATFDDIAANEPDRFFVVDASEPIDVVIALVFEHLEARWPR
jgi:dTMP kinase